MTRPRPIAAADCETDPFKKRQMIHPFIWGYYDGKLFQTFKTTKEFVEFIRTKRITLFAHNGGKFDFVYLLEYVPLYSSGKIQMINGRIVSMMLGDCELRDSYAIMPEPLKDLGGKKEIEYWKLGKEHRAKYADEIRDYLFYDCSVLFDAVAAFRVAAGKHKTIASNALAFAKKLGIDPGKSNHRFDSEYRQFYYGGRTELFKDPGKYNDLVMLDIHSAYPAAMMLDHATGTNFNVKDNMHGLSKEQLQRSFIELRCYSDGAFPVRWSSGVQGLSFPRGHSDDVCEPPTDTKGNIVGNPFFAVTGWEYLAAKDLGLIKDEKILAVHYSNDTINFKDYIEYWYAEKLKWSAKDKNGERIHKANYAIAKRLMNSLYGKLAQNPANYFDYKIMPAGSPLPCRQFVYSRKGNLCKECGLNEDGHGYSLAQEYDKFEFHCRETMWRYKYKYGALWDGVPLYKNVATGASVTGCVRANLLRAMFSVGRDSVIYCDTDSIIALGNADISRLAITDKLGDWELEDQNSPVGYFAGKKLYAIEMTTGKKKIASKGAKLTFEDVKTVAEGGTVTWESEAPSFGILTAAQGSMKGKRRDLNDPKRRHSIDDSATFVVRNIKATASRAAVI